MPDDTDYTLEQLHDVNQNLRNTQLAADELLAQQTVIVQNLLAQGYRQRQLADVTGLSRGRIAQIAMMPKAVAA